MSARRLCACALVTALLCVISPWSVPIGPVPISLATLAVYLAGALLGPRDGALSVAAFLLLGLAGLPVFTGFAGGAAKFAGPTGGYLLGYLPCAAIAGFAAHGENARRWRYALWMAAGTAVLYALGTAWFCVAAQSSVGAALGLCVLPFLPGDAAKIAAVCWIAPALRRRLTEARR